MSFENTDAPAGVEAPSSAPATQSTPADPLAILDFAGDDEKGNLVPLTSQEDEPDESPDDELDEVPAETTDEDEEQPSDEDEKPAKDSEKAEPETPKPDDDGFAKNEMKTRLRDGSEVTIADLKKRADEAQELRAQLTQRPREIEQAAAEIARQQQTLQQLLPVAIAAATQNIPPEPDPSMIDSDPVQYFQDRARYDNAVHNLRNLHAASQQQTQQAQQQRTQQFQHYVQEQRGKLVEAIPELREPAKAQEFVSGFAALANDLGFTTQEAASVYDHRLFKLVKEAMDGRAAKAELATLKAKQAEARTKVVEKVKAVPPVTATPAAPAGRVSPAEAARSGTRVLQERLKRNPSDTATADALLSRFTA